MPTINPPGDAYRPCAEAIATRLRPRGFTTWLIRAEGTPGDSDRYPRTNVLARHEGRRPGPCVHFNGHIDVVAAGQGWRYPPFEPVIEAGRIYGRGACDMKGGLAAAIVAVETLIEQVPDFAGALEISGTVDEESGGYGGVAHMARQGLFSKPRVDHVIIPEPLQVDRVCIGHRGVYWAEIETHGRIAHGSMPFLGTCAVRHMGAVIERIERELLPALAARHTAMPVVPDAARASTLNINSIHGGQDPAEADGLPSPCVPDSCRMIVDRRFLAEERLDEVKAELRALLEALRAERHDFRYSLRDVMEVLPSLTPVDSPLVQALQRELTHLFGRQPDLVCSPGTYDQKHIQRIGHLQHCVAYGPGRLELAHQPDEWVAIDDLVKSAQVMAMTAHSLLHGDKR